MKIGTIKIRPVILLIALGLVTALVLMVIMLIQNIEKFDGVTLAVVVALVGNIITAIAGVASKLIESEEKGT